MNNIEEILKKSIIKNQNIAFDLNYYLAENPEEPGKEYNSCKKIVNILESYGIKTEEKYCGLDTAFKGTIIKNPNSDIKIGIITEYDALIGLGHACGHSASAAISLLSALTIKENENLFDVNIDIIGTPDEENEGLKIPMCDKGAFDDYNFVIMVHMDSKTYPCQRFLAFETYEIEFTGKPAHAAASPWEGRSALDALMLTIHSFDMLRKTTKPKTIIEGFITDGGIMTNIIPEKAVGKYTFRSDSSKYLKEELMPRIYDAVNGCANAMQTEVKMKPFGYPFADLNWNEPGVQLIRDVLRDNNIEFIEQEGPGGSSDIGNVSYRCPAFHPTISITDKEVSLHTKEFADIVKSKNIEQPIVNGATIITSFIARAVEDNEILENIKKEFELSK